MILIFIILSAISLAIFLFFIFKHEVQNISPLKNEKYLKDHRVALHEASHAILAWASNRVDNITHVDLNPTMGCGAVSYEYIKASSAASKWSNIVISLGGLLIEAHQYGRFRSGDCTKDLQDSIKASYELVQMGSVKAPWPAISQEHYVPFEEMFVSISPPQLSILHQCYAMAFKVLCSHRGSLFKLTDLFIERSKDNYDTTLFTNELVKCLYSRWFITSSLFTISPHIFLIGDSSEESFISQNFKSNNTHAKKNSLLTSLNTWLWGR